MDHGTRLQITTGLGRKSEVRVPPSGRGCAQATLQDQQVVSSSKKLGSSTENETSKNGQRHKETRY